MEGTLVRRLIILLAVSMVPSGLAAQRAAGPTPATCALFTSAIEIGLRRLAYATYSGDADSSAIRQGVRQQMATNALLVIQANLHQLQAHLCPPYELPITPDLYEDSARKCEGAPQAPRKPAPVFVMDPCDMSYWKRSQLQPMGGLVIPKP